MRANCRLSHTQFRYVGGQLTRRGGSPQRAAFRWCFPDSLWSFARLAALSKNIARFSRTAPRAVSALDGARGLLSTQGLCPGLRGQDDLLRSYPPGGSRVEPPEGLIGRCVVTGPIFNGAVTLYAPLRTPTEALEAILRLARHSVDAERALRGSGAYCPAGQEGS
jgi:hypothetical protein